MDDCEAVIIRATACSSSTLVSFFVYESLAPRVEHELVSSRGNALPLLVKTIQGIEREIDRDYLWRDLFTR